MRKNTNPWNKEELREERKSFILGFLALLALAILYRLLVLIEFNETIATIGIFGTIFSKMFWVYLVYRFSDFLKNPKWLTILYCVLAVFSILYLIPLIGLLLKASSMEHQIELKEKKR